MLPRQHVHNLQNLEEGLFMLSVPLRRTTVCAVAVGALSLGAPALADEIFPVAEVAPILNQHPCTRVCKVQADSSDYTLTPIDLNGDGTYEYLVGAESACGSGGCFEALFMRLNGGWKKLLDNQGEIKVMSSRTNGFADVLVSCIDYEPQKHEVRTTYRWDGQRYRAK